MRPLLPIVSVVLLAVFAPLTALAAPVYYDDQGVFLAAAGTTLLESFEGETATNSFTTTSIALAFFMVTEDFDTTPDLGIWNIPFVGGFATHGVNWLGYQSGADESLRFDFLMSINSFGINITDWGDFGTGTLTFSNDLGDMFQVDVTPNPDGDHQFFGVIIADMAFDTVTFTQSIAGEFYGVDEIYFGTTPPISVQPSSWGGIKALYAN